MKSIDIFSIAFIPRREGERCEILDLKFNNTRERENSFQARKLACVDQRSPIATRVAYSFIHILSAFSLREPRR